MTFQRATVVRFAFILIVAFFGLIVLASAAYTVDETEQVIVVQFGEVIGDPIKEPGLHFKKPFIQEVRRFDKRLLRWDGSPREIPTKGREFIYVDTTARWRIADPKLFLERVRDVRGAISRMDDIVESAVRDEISSSDFLEIVRSRDWSINEEDLTEELALSKEVIDTLTMEIERGREELTRNMLARASAKTRTLGIELEDVRIKRLNYIPSVREKVYDRMIAERQRIAAKYESEGRGRSAEIRGQTEKQLLQIESEARRTVAVIQGQGEAEATRIYGDAYNAAPEFYAFLRTLESYGSTLSGQATLILGTDSDYYRYLKSIGQVGDELEGIDIQERLEALKDNTPVELDIPEIQVPETEIPEETTLPVEEQSE